MKYQVSLTLLQAPVFFELAGRSMKLLEFLSHLLLPGIETVS